MCGKIFSRELSVQDIFSFMTVSSCMIFFIGLENAFYKVNVWQPFSITVKAKKVTCNDFTINRTAPNKYIKDKKYLRLSQQ